MKTFQDNSGTKWALAVDPFLVKRIQAELGYNILDLRLDDQALKVWFENPMRMVDTLWILCAEAAAARHVEEAAFGRLLRGVLFEAGVALLEELTDFFPLQSQREELKARLALQLKTMELEHETAAWMVKQFQDAIAATKRSGTAFNSPGSSASAPTV